MPNPFSIDTGPARILVRVRGQAALTGSKARLSLAGRSVSLEPLCPNEHRSKAIGLASSHHWYVAELDGPADSPGELWTLAHEALGSKQLAAAGGNGFAEPDMPQTWQYENRVTVKPGTLGAAPGETCEYNPQDAAFPEGPTPFAWHLADGYSQLKSAREAARASGKTVRIGILDTGIDLEHRAMPANLRLDIARNFVRDGRDPNDVRDPYERGLFNNPGHGTGTIGLLAGRRFRPSEAGVEFDDAIGGAPDAEIIPLRIATSVILFKTSAVAEALDYLIAPGGKATLRADVVSMSMGGLASHAWADVVNRAYEAGIVIVTAAGNNYPGTPQFIVYPARFGRVIAACGVMANGQPYIREHVPAFRMAGNYGPPSKMTTALAAYTPNTPWAEINCENIVDMDGAGTSSATPQIAAAAALWLQKHKGSLKYNAPWKIVEAVRHALFSSAQQPSDDLATYLGRGILHARAALDQKAPANPKQTPADSAAFELLRGLFGLPAAPSPREAMLELELTQLIQTDAALSASLGDTDTPGRALDDAQRRSLIDQVVSGMAASPLLKAALKNAYPAKYRTESATKAAAHARAAGKTQPRRTELPMPTRRLLRGYAFDPQLSTELESVEINEIVYDIPWEKKLAPGPCGDYLEVIDYDPASRAFYEPVDLNAPELLATDGHAPSEGNPQFHQQMVYAVIMTTIGRFERALGRRVQWSPRIHGHDDRTYVGQLRVYPHALRQQNAYYDPQRKALLFGYFPAVDVEPGRVYPGGMVFTCLSQDIVAHESTHAILDGMHRALLHPSNPDTLAFHEAFADLVALFQHFHLPGALRHQIAKARGDLRARNLLAELAVQFGQATGRYGALRSAIGRIDPETKAWTPVAPDPSALMRTREPHARGAILVAAVFEAFLKIYERRIADLLRIATAGSGVLPAGALHPDLVARLSDEAAMSAGHMLTMCVRALDYCPPVDLTFGDYLRALITADVQIVPEDRLGYRTAVVEAFRAWGIYPKGLRALAVDSLLWDRPRPALQKLLRPQLKALQPYASSYTYLHSRDKPDPRRETFGKLSEWRAVLHDRISDFLISLDAADRQALVEDMGIDLDPGYASFELRSLQFTRKVSPDGNEVPQALLSFIQERSETADGGSEAFTFRGGCTVIVDLLSGEIDYVIRKNVRSGSRLAAEKEFHLESRASLAGMYLGAANDADPSRQLALLHGMDPEIDHGQG
ncbi:MAG: S8 family serine peptidase [Betaproteobacteria bacterium]|jgi:hypothetical protein|nr:S8 family serine peptidase [Betaproteobacteria bacterium]